MDGPYLVIGSQHGCILFMNGPSVRICHGQRWALVIDGPYPNGFSGLMGPGQGWDLGVDGPLSSSVWMGPHGLSDGCPLGRNGPSAWMGYHGPSRWMGPGQRWALIMDEPWAWMDPHGPLE